MPVYAAGAGPTVHMHYRWFVWFAKAKDTS